MRIMDAFSLFLTHLQLEMHHPPGTTLTFLTLEWPTPSATRPLDCLNSTRVLDSCIKSCRLGALGFVPG